ncbi:hypothetical protein GQ44DRAFT_767506 [Phaeosphaeriaceae sp. PMI808]|nr:hypothetical protein GQ44DRAFT_767506 [Phaeosphaeriaceae sp. PMI808]
MANFSASSEMFRYGSQGLEDHRSQTPLHDNNSGAAPENYHQSQVVTGSDLSFHPWLLDVSSGASPMSSNSPPSGSESISTPQQYIDQTPMYQMIDHSIPLVGDYAARDSSYMHNSELTWSQQFAETEANNVQLPPPHLPASMWNGSSYGGPPLPPMDYYVQPSTSGVTTSFIEPASEYNSAHNFSDSAPFRACDTDDVTTGSDSDSDSSGDGYESSSYGQRKDSRSSLGSKQKESLTTPVLKLGRWSMITDPLTQPEQRHYACPLRDTPDAKGRLCGQRFVRPEHLRRHIKTVHGDERNYCCKVPQCGRAFSRGDNLRDHYWTHLHRGGRRGKNDKMSLADLKIILGPKEKKLLRRLKQRLLEQKGKHKMHSINNTNNMIRAKL